MVFSNSYEGAFDYEELLKLRAMDPGQAELYKSRKLKEYNEARIGRAIQAAKELYAAHVTQDPNGTDRYAQELREAILQIPGIAESDKPEHKDLYTRCKAQMEVLDDLQTATQGPIIVDQPGMADLGADAPEETPVAEPQPVEIDEPMADLGTDEPEVAPVVEAPVDEEVQEDKTEEIASEPAEEPQEEVKDTKKAPKRKIVFKNKK